MIMYITLIRIELQRIYAQNLSYMMACFELRLEILIFSILVWAWFVYDWMIQIIISFFCIPSVLRTIPLNRDDTNEDSYRKPRCYFELLKLKLRKKFWDKVQVDIWLSWSKPKVKNIENLSFKIWGRIYLYLMNHIYPWFSLF